MTEPAEPHPEAFPADLAGRQLHDFRLLRLLGRGAMAEVYLAEQSALKRQVAVKVLKSALAKDETYVKRFLREAQAAASLSHANIVQIHEVGCVDGIYYIAQEYVQGMNLRQWMARHGTADLRLAVTLLRQVAAALAKAAEQGIVHRDIKPENIMLTREGEVKVADFGLARLPPRLGEVVDLTQMGMTLGTPLYMSPEQVEGKALDHRSDLYSLGVTCYHILAGSPPFVGDTALGVAVQHLKKPPEPLENLRPDLPPALCRIVHKMLAKAPDKRYQSARELLRDLHQIQLEHFGSQWSDEVMLWDSAPAAAPAAPSIDVAQRLDSLMKTSSITRLPRPRWSWWITAGLTAFALGAGAAYYLTAQPPLLAHSNGRLVARQDNVFRQYLYAIELGTEEAWQAVIDYFPDRPYWGYRAKQQLARLYLYDQRLEQAMAIFKEFAALDRMETELRAYGLAGECAVLSMQGKYRESAMVLDELLPIRSQLKDPLMRQMLGYALRTNREKLGATTTTQKWKEWLDKQFPEAG